MGRGGCLHGDVFDVLHSQTDEDVVHRECFCVGGRLVSLVGLLLGAGGSFLFYLL